MNTPITDEAFLSMQSAESKVDALLACSEKLELENARLRDQLHSARYILEECGAGQLSQISGLPEGVVVSALENILSNVASEGRRSEA
jgi:hypothetical protein